MSSLNTVNSLETLHVDNKTYHYYSLPKAFKQLGNVSALPISLKVLLENLLRWEDGVAVTHTDIQELANWLNNKHSDHEIQFHPARILMQDFTGVPAVVDLAAMRSAMSEVGADPKKINPLSPVDLVIDHSVMVDKYASQEAFKINVEMEMARNHERYTFLRWGQNSFDNFRVVPPGTGICHQVNLEYLGRSVWTKEKDGKTYAFPDTLVGTDSHTTMINGLGVLGWGVGGIEAEAAMLGQPMSMLIPDVIGFKLIGRLKEGITATDLVLTITQMLRKKGVVGKFVEFYGDGLAYLPLADRATIANMAPEYGATCGFFPVDQITLDYLQLTGRSVETIKLVESYCKTQGLWREVGQEPIFTDTLTLDMGSVEPSLAGPKRPQDRVSLTNVPEAFNDFLALQLKTTPEDKKTVTTNEVNYTIDGKTIPLKTGAIVIAAITSCTNTSNPSVMMAAGLLAKKAVEKGLQPKPWVKTSLAPGSKVVTDYYQTTGLTKYLDMLGFNLVGYGCTTCIGNSGPLLEPIEKAITDADLTVAAVLSGNRNFEGRIHPLVKANWLASPPLVVAYALAGNIYTDITKEPLGHDQLGNAVYLKDIWPSQQEIAEAVKQVSSDMYHKEYSAVFNGDATWQAIKVPQTDTYNWQDNSSYIQKPPFFENISEPLSAIKNITSARILAIFGDSVTTDHISPAGNIKANSPAGIYLKSLGVAPADFNSYGSRRGNHQVMMRGTFANIRIKNEMLGGEEGGFTLYMPTKEKLAIYDAAMRYQQQKVPLIVVAGKEYGTGSSRDWAAKGTNLLGVKAVIAESYERIHRSNLVGMGVLPLQFLEGQNRQTLRLIGDELLSITGLEDVVIKPQMPLILNITRHDGTQEQATVLCRIDTLNEVEYFKAGGILHYVLRQLLK